MAKREAGRPTLYLHIGTNKTGSTAIQNFCAEHRRELARLGYCYPDIPYASRATSGNAAFLMYLRDSDGEPDARIWNSCMDGISRKFRSYPSVILSSEEVWNQPNFRNRGMWERLKAESDARGFALRILVYLRRQDALLCSFWAQKVKSATSPCGRLRFADMLSQAEDWLVLDYHRQLERISAILGRDAIIARIYDRRHLPDGNVVTDFFEAIGLRSGLVFSSAGRERNPSIRGNALEFKRILNSLPKLSGDAARILRRAALACTELEQGGAEYSMFSEAELSAFLARYEESNRRLARDYLGFDGMPFEPPEPLPPKWEPENPQMLASLVRFLFLATRQGDLDGAPLAKLRRRLAPRRRLRALRNAVRRKLGWMG